MYNKHFSNEARKVPAHMGHFIQLPVLQRLVDTFPRQWDLTRYFLFVQKQQLRNVTLTVICNSSSHAFRASDDMQFAFSYFYFLINERREWNLPSIFANVDSDASHDLSPNEFRSLWVLMHDPPIDEAAMNDKWAQLR
jgi:UDP-N-acetylglucosamine-lysosomal-enzyme